MGEHFPINGTSCVSEMENSFALCQEVFIIFCIYKIYKDRLMFTLCLSVCHAYVRV